MRLSIELLIKLTVNHVFVAATFSLLVPPFLFFGFFSAGTNLAINKQTVQVSTLSGYPSSNGIDGSYNSFMVTMGSTTGVLDWWSVDLGFTFNVQGIQMSNRQDCCG